MIDKILNQIYNLSVECKVLTDTILSDAVHNRNNLQHKVNILELQLRMNTINELFIEKMIKENE
jgi:hypothetical protein